MAVDLLEGNLSCQAKRKHDHASDPEEQDIPTSLKDGCGEKVLEIDGVLVGPAESAKGPETGRVPSVKDVLITLKCELLALELLRSLLLSLL